ncbi:MAG: histidine kinase dimerization/phosphoacceptor domain -containing protein [Cyclonatronaceae bacterium]
MGKPLKVLIIEDLPDDAELVALELQRAGYETDMTRVETAEALKKALEDISWDVIISDYNLPGFDGLAALEIVSESSLDIPFIVISGTVGEEIAVEAVLAGAHDYVMKDNLKRIPVAVDREIRNSKLRKEKRIADQKIRDSLEEKEVMLKEIHHRVKNNLAVISALLTLQSDHVQDETAKELFMESVGRIKSMALIHEKLYQSEMFARVEMGDYMRQLVKTIQETYESQPRDITVHVECDNAVLDITRAIPCGLIINELLSNVYKHAFRDSETGNVYLRLKKDEETNECELQVMDDGVGLPKEVIDGKSSSLGYNIIRGLARQLSADLHMTGSHGTHVLLRFKA